MTNQQRMFLGQALVYTRQARANTGYANAEAFDAPIARRVARILERLADVEIDLERELTDHATTNEPDEPCDTGPE